MRKWAVAFFILGHMAAGATLLLCIPNEDIIGGFLSTILLLSPPKYWPRAYLEST